MKTPTWPLRVAAGLVGVLFVLFAALQLNDPDPEVWATFYGAAALVCFAAASGHSWPPLTGLFGLGSLAFALPLLGALRHTSWGDLFDFASMKTVATEESREALGLVFVAIWMGVLWWVSRRARKP
jgi:hypothetical protein